MKLCMNLQYRVNPDTVNLMVRVHEVTRKMAKNVGKKSKKKTTFKKNKKFFKFQFPKNQADLPEFILKTKRKLIDRYFINYEFIILCKNYSSLF